MRYLRSAFVGFAGGAPQVEQITSQQLQSSGGAMPSSINTLLGTITLLLYRLDIDGANRNPTAWVRPPSGGPLKMRYGLPLDLRYLVTSWADAPEKQQLIMGKAMTALDGHRTFAGANLISSVGGASDIWRNDDSFQFIPDDMGTEDLYQIWESLGRSFELSVPYKARVVRLEPDELSGGDVVLERDLVYGRAVAGSDEESA